MPDVIPNVLSIAGSDPSGGAGIQADLKTFAALGVYGMAAVSGLTAQNTCGVTAIQPLPARLRCRRRSTPCSKTSASTRSSSACWAGPPLLGTLDVPDAGDLLPAARGHLHVDWRVAGPGLSAASVAIDGGDLAYGDIAAAGVTGRFDIDRPRNRLRLRVDAPDVAIGDQKLALHATADGTAVDHAFDSTLTRNGATLDLRGRGSVLADGWRARVERGALRGAPPATSTLDGPLAVDLRRDVVVVERHCWRAGDARLCADGQRTAGVLNVTADVHALPIAPLVALTGDDVTVDSALDGRAHLHRDAGALSGELHLAAPPGAVVTHTPDGEPRRLAHGGLRIDGQLAAQGGRLEARLAQPEGSGDLIGASLRLPPLPAGAAAPLQGRLDAQLPDIGLFEPWAPALVGLAGSAAAQLRVDGTLGAPRVRVRQRHLRGGAASVPALGIELHEVTAGVQGDGGDTLRLTGQRALGRGHARAQRHGRPSRPAARASGSC